MGRLFFLRGQLIATQELKRRFRRRKGSTRSAEAQPSNWFEEREGVSEGTGGR